MNKVKSAICLTLISIVIAGLIFMCSAMFAYGQAGQTRFNSIFAMMDKDAQYGGLTYDDDGTEFANGEAMDKENLYRGGGFFAVYYPEGVISEKEYEDNLAAYPTDDTEGRDEYVKQYRKVGSLYFESELVDKTGSENAPTAAFEKDFGKTVGQLKARIESLEMESAFVEERGDYCVQVYLPSLSARGDNSELLSVFTYVSRIGEFTLAAGTSGSETEISAEETRSYIRSVSAITISSTPAVAVSFTDEGATWLAGQTSGATSSSAISIQFRVGGTTVSSVSVGEAVTASTIYLSKTSSTAYTPFEARAVASTINSSLENEGAGIKLSIGEFTFEKAQFGDLALILLYVAFGVLALAMLVFFFVRYHGLAVAHLYSFLIYLLPMILLLWGIPFIHLNAWSVLAIAFGALLLSASDAISYESARKEYALGKTMASSVKTGYKKCFWLIFDVHAAVAIFAFITYFISLTQLSVFAFTLGLAAILSGLCSLAVNRFHWAMLMTFTKKPGAFCNFKREEVSDDE